jgi:hypothetical protein
VSWTQILSEPKLLDPDSDPARESRTGYGSSGTIESGSYPDPGTDPAQSRQSAKLFLQSSELGLPPTPHPQASVPPLGSGGWGTLAGERVGGRVPIPTRGHKLRYSVNISRYFVGSGFTTLLFCIFYKNIIRHRRKRMKLFL